jgi:hypothetical protein
VTVKDSVFWDVIEVSDDNIKNDLVEIGWGVVEMTCLAQDRDKCRAFVNVAMNLLIP